MNKTKEYWGYFVAFLVGLAGALALFLRGKGRSSEEILKETKEQSSKIDEEIKVIEHNRKKRQKDIDKVESDLVQNTKDKESALKEHEGMTDQEKEDWWNNQ